MQTGARHPMMRPKRTCTTADTASAAPAKRLRHGAASSAVGTGTAALGVEESGAGPAVPSVHVTTGGHIKEAAADSCCQTRLVQGAAVASPCGRQAGAAASNRRLAAELSTQGRGAACSAARTVSSLPAAEPAFEPEQAVGAAAAAAAAGPAASRARAGVPLSSASTAAEAAEAGDTEVGTAGDAGLTERLRIASRCFEERRASYSRLYECVLLPAECLTPSGRSWAGQVSVGAAP